MFKAFCENAKKVQNREQAGNDNFLSAWNKMIVDIINNGQINPYKINNWDVTLNAQENPQIGKVPVTYEAVYEIYKGECTDKVSEWQRIILKHLEDNFNLTEYRINTTDKSGEPFVFIIDEINRGNISKIFGELITLIEPSKRIGADSDEEKVVKLPYSGKHFGVPDNVYIIGTMNTADRSLTKLDTALRRRFIFQEMMPKPELLKDNVLVRDKSNSKYGVDTQELLTTLNKRLEVLLDRELTIGHAFFIGRNAPKTMDELGKVMENKILPLLQEYFFNDYEKIKLCLGDKPDDTTNCFIRKALLEEKKGNLFKNNEDNMKLLDDIAIYEVVHKNFNNILAYENLGRITITSGADEQGPSLDEQESSPETEN